MIWLYVLGDWWGVLLAEGLGVLVACVGFGV